MTQRWLEVTVELPERAAESVASFLFDLGTPGLQCEQHGTRSALTAYFSNAEAIDQLRGFLAQLDDDAGAAIKVRGIGNEDWAESWKQHFSPQPIGERLYVTPPWGRVTPAGKLAITIEPGMAFGTGQHATTRGCLVLLEQVILRRRIDRALDLGTGSGILAIALAKLGVAEVHAIDIDPTARAIAAQNAVKNGVQQQVRIGSSLDSAPGECGLIVANLFANALERLAPQIVAALRPGGTTIATGFLVADEVQMQRAFSTVGCTPDGRYEEDGWVTLRWNAGRCE